MPYDDADPEDPSILCGVELNASLDDMREMAYAFGEEYARLGHSAQEIALLFRSDQYGGAHLAWRALGAEELEVIAAECASVFGRVRLAVVDVPEYAPPTAPGRLPMVR